MGTIPPTMLVNALNILQQQLQQQQQQQQQQQRSLLIN